MTGHDGIGSDETVTFYAEWHGVRYRLGRTTPPKPLRILPPDRARQAAMRDPSLLRMPQGRLTLEIDFQPCLYRQEDDPDDMPDRETLYVRARQLAPGDYIVISRENFNDALKEE